MKISLEGIRETILQMQQFYDVDIWGDARRGNMRRYICNISRDNNGCGWERVILEPMTKAHILAKLGLISRLCGFGICRSPIVEYKGIQPFFLGRNTYAKEKKGWS